MAWAPINGIQLYYELHGSGADTVVFAHGGAGNHLSWWQQVAFFEDRYRCVVFDHRGFGGSIDVEGGPGLAAFAEDLRGLLDHLGIDRAFLAAQSMGGRTCLGFTVAFPERVKGLVMSDTVGTIEEAELSRMREALQAGEPAPTSLEGQVYSPAFKLEKPALAFLYDSITALNPPHEPIAPARLRPPDRFVATPERLARPKVPVLFVVGQLEVLISPQMIRHAASLVPGARLFEAPGCGHSVYFEDPSTWNRVVAEFFDSIGHG